MAGWRPWEGDLLLALNLHFYQRRRLHGLATADKATTTAATAAHVATNIFPILLEAGGQSAIIILRIFL